MQPPGDFKNIFLMGDTTSRIQYNDNSSEWIITDAMSNLIAKSNASKVSYVLGKHSWTIINDKSPCNPHVKGQYDLQGGEWTLDTRLTPASPTQHN